MTKLKINIEQQAIDGRVMLVELINGHKRTAFNDTIEVDISLPCSVTLVFSGKNNMTDTIVDQDNNILADMYTKVISMELDDIPIPDVYIQKYLCINTGDQEIYASYIGFNGQMTIPFDKPTVFQQINWYKNRT